MYQPTPTNLKFP
jgi:hypothetical protein